MLVELAQQSKIRNRLEFIEAFSPVMAEAIALAYKGAPSEVQNKIKRVVDVWRDRQVFEQAIQDAVDGRIAGWSTRPSRTLYLTDFRTNKQRNRFGQAERLAILWCITFQFRGTVCSVRTVSASS